MLKQRYGWEYIKEASAKFWHRFLIAVTITVVLVTIIDLSTVSGLLLEKIRSIFPALVFLFVAVGLLSFIVQFWLDLWYPGHLGLLKDISKSRKEIKSSCEGLYLDGSIADAIWNRNGNPPLFVIGKDLEDHEKLRNVSRSLDTEEVLKLESFKPASMFDIASAIALAHLLARKWTDRRAEVNEIEAPLGVIDIEAVKRNLEKIIADRSIISIGAGDPNAMTAKVFCEFAREYHTVPPLRFSSSNTSETILANTQQGLSQILLEDPRQTHDFGLIFAADRKAGRTAKKKSLWVICAGLHREGTKASCLGLGYIANEYYTNEGNQLYSFSEELNLPYALVDLTDDVKDRVQFFPVIHKRKKIIGESIETDSELEAFDKFRRRCKCLIVLGYCGREDGVKGKDYVRNRDAVRMIDFVVRYTVNHHSEGISVEVRTLTSKQLESFCAEEVIEEFDEIIALGTKQQNYFVEFLCREYPKVEDLYQDPKESGVVIVCSLDKAKIAVIYGDNSQNTQSAILRLAELTRGQRISAVQDDSIDHVEAEGLGDFEGYVQRSVMKRSP